MSKFDLAQKIFDKIEELGPESAAAFFERTVSVIRKWQGGTAIPDVKAAQKILDEALEAQEVEIPVFEQPPPQGETRPPPQPKIDPDPHTTEGRIENLGDVERPSDPERLVQIAKKGKQFGILIPTNRDFAPAVVLSALGNWKSTLPVEIREQLASMDIEQDTVIHHARNILATRFLASENEWSFWMDSDVIAPVGNPAWFKRRTGANYPDKWMSTSAIERLTSRNKTLIGGVYAQRNTGGGIMASFGLHPQNEADKQLSAEIKTKGPHDKVVQINWIGFGCVAVHRKVFEDVLEKVPGVRGENGKAHGFFTAFEKGPSGEDVAFCKRAAQAGHPTFMDMSVFCGHVGRFSFLP